MPYAAMSTDQPAPPRRRCYLRRLSGSLTTPLNGLPSFLTAMNSPRLLLPLVSLRFVKSPVLVFLTWVRPVTAP